MKILAKGREFRMLARRLNDAGIARFRQFLEELRIDADVDAPQEILTAEETSEPIDAEIHAAACEFHSRLEIAEHVNGILKTDTAALRNDAGFWTWLSLGWFRELCPVIAERRVPGDDLRWIAELHHPARAARHMLAGPYQIYRAHRDDPRRALSLLCGPVHHTGSLVALIASRPSLVTCKAVVGAATRLFYNSQSGRNRSGIDGREPGSARRFADVLSQLDMTWDLHSLSTEELLDLLPEEFDHFRRHDREERRGRHQRSLLD